MSSAPRKKLRSLLLLFLLLYAVFTLVPVSYTHLTLPTIA